MPLKYIYIFKFDVEVKCDAIKQNESELENTKNSLFIFIVFLHVRAIPHWKPHNNWAYDWAYSYFSDAQNNKIQRKLNTIIGSI